MGVTGNVRNRFSATSGRLACAALLLSVAGCGDPDEQQPAADGEQNVAVISGQVIYRERMLLPPEAEIEVQLQDISRADAMATVMASVMLKPQGGPPYPFEIEYDPSRINERMRYALRATISVGNRLMFTSTDYIDPFAAEQVEVLVRRVAEPVSRGSASLEDTTWVLQTLSGEAAPAGADGRPVDFLLRAEETRVSGFSGCNRYTGSYSREGNASRGNPLSFGPLAGTLMACVEGGELEREFLDALANVTGYTLEGEVLSLLTGDDVVATFRPR